jgi:hypothetical protein
MPESTIEGFVFGSRVDRAIPAPASTREDEPISRSPRRSRRRPSKRAINKAIEDHRSALAKERANYVADLDLSRDVSARVIRQTGEAAELLQEIAAKIHGQEVLEQGYGVCEPVAFETDDDHIVVTLPAWICGALTNEERPLTIAIHKSAIVKLARFPIQMNRGGDPHRDDALSTRSAQGNQPLGPIAFPLRALLIPITSNRLPWPPHAHHRTALASPVEASQGPWPPSSRHRPDKAT